MINPVFVWKLRLALLAVSHPHLVHPKDIKWLKAHGYIPEGLPK